MSQTFDLLLPELPPEDASEVSEFRPLPLLRNAHLQTLLGHFFPTPAFKHPSVPHVLRLEDGDALVLHDSKPTNWQPLNPIAVIVHGLTGSHNSAQVRRLAIQLLKAGQRVVRLDLRGSGHALPLSRGFYHGGCSDDVRAAIAEVHAWSPTSPLVLIGFSLGGNISLKLAGEAADHPVPGLARVAALAPPIDMEACVALFTRRLNRIYEKAFLRELIRDAEARQRHFPDLPPLSWPKRLTIRAFDDYYTAPRRGFADSSDYYRRVSSKSLIPRIPVPALIVTAADDPFIAVEPFRDLRVPSHVDIRIHPHGGHLGFLGRDGAGGFRWAERRVVDWVMGNR